MERRKITSITFGALLVLSAMFAPLGGNTSMVQTAQADDWVDGCFVGPVWVIDVGGVVCNEPQKEDLQKVDALETEQAMYESALTQKNNNNVFGTSMGNYLNDTTPIALMEGKNAYIRALNNGSSEPAARAEATEAVADYYAVKQKQLIASWNITISLMKHMRATAYNTSGVNTNYVHCKCGDAPWKNYANVQPRSVQLVNGSSTLVAAFSVDKGWDPPNYNYLHIAHKPKAYYPGEAGGYATFEGLYINPPNDNYNGTYFYDHRKFYDKWTDIEAQNNAVQNQLDTFVSNTYEKYQRGEINTSDLVDPYLGMREYSPENASKFQSWTLRMLTSMGLNPPENLSNIGHMDIRYKGYNYTGILMSDGNPPNGFTIGNTYNSSKLSGEQFIALQNGGSQDLEGKFTLLSAVTSGGKTYESGKTITYKNVTYGTSSIEQYQELMQKLTNLQQQINERQQTLWSGGGGMPSAPNWLTRNYFGFPLYAYIAGVVLLGYVANSIRGN